MEVYTYCPFLDLYLNSTGHANPSYAHQSAGVPPTELHPHGGYECKFVEPPAPDLQTKCGICSLILRNPYQTKCCGSIFCNTCVEWIQEQGKPCQECNEAEFSTFQDKTFQRSINELKVQCTHQKRGCVWTGELGKLDEHLNVKPSVCDELLVGCEFTNIECGFSYAGCKAQMPRKDMRTHMEYEASSHVQLLAETLKERNKQIEEKDKQIKKRDEQIEELTTKFQSQGEMLQGIKQQVINIGLQLGNQLPEPIAKQISDLVWGNEELQQFLDTPTPRKPSAVPLQQILVSIDHYFTMDEFEVHKTNDEDWCSEPFYTHPQGYKMCVQIYANGDDKECGTHVSLYTCFMRGEYDNELLWPFQGKIAVELRNQKTDDPEQGGHHECIMHYDENTPDPYAQRVTVGQKGPGWGKSQFIPHFKLDPDYDSAVQYLKDGCLKFRVRDALLSIPSKE